MKISRISISLFFIWINLIGSGVAQAPRSYTSSEILVKLQKLNVLGNALYVAAHPDDENTRMITYLANDLKVNAAYLSMTRGDGGQNLIGPEIREQLGIIRTQELLAARRIDGGQQFFTRANDFGYSKNTEETQAIWERDEVLKDVVWVFRQFRPDVIITRFPGDGRGRHGHHTTSAILASEAFRLSGDPSVFPEQLEYVDPWSPKRFVTNTGRWWNDNINDEDEGVLAVDVGGFSPLLGRSFTEIAAQSRSQHKSQGFGATGSRGVSEEFLEHQYGVLSEEDLFDGVNLTWSRVVGGDRIRGHVDNIIEKFDPRDPGKIIKDLVELRAGIAKLNDDFWRQKKISEVDELIKICAGLYVETTVNQFSAVPGETIEITVEAINRSEIPIVLKGIEIPGADFSKNIEAPLEMNIGQELREKVIIRKDQPYSNPYWLNASGSLGMYRVDDQLLRGKPENDPALQAKITVGINDEVLEYVIPVVHKWNDRVEGESYRPFVIQPLVMVNTKSKVVIFPDNSSKQVDIEVVAGRGNIQGTLSLDLPDGWKSRPAIHPMVFEAKDEIQQVSFEIIPPVEEQFAEITPRFNSEGKVYDQNRVTISYDHIPTQTLFPKASAKLVRLNIVKKGDMIGYIMGAGDEIPESLEQIGYRVWVMNEEDITSENLATLDAVIMGVRVVNTIGNFKQYKSALMKYVEDGGTLIFQYNTTRGIDWQDFAPYELGFTGGSADSRVSVEEAPITVLKPDHPVMNYPNQITNTDFNGWVQERGLYFPGSWDPEYEAILSSNDPGEEPKNGGLLIAKYGQGHYVYTGYAWFRQLPAGVPGAYRLFTNIISLGNGDNPGNSNTEIKE